ncbi:hypothetical protein GJ744_007428 [Endocarpon pusillum]|uniref:Retrovirus-related Pol polyprotein from transposon TNT 1-94-like beta-barrel domain-containing protein n=1 Tax=Endocarpon pusillum TaxID=364733 RepID=A0A8H7A4M0_9EURO|nr:hypothetical protein GJ744_007428 [Endocarpon pusillum]
MISQTLEELEKGLTKGKNKDISARSAQKKGESAHYSKGSSSLRRSSRNPDSFRRSRPRRRRSFSSSSASSTNSKKELSCWRYKEPGHVASECPDAELIVRLLREHKKKSSSRSISKGKSRSSSRPLRQSRPRESHSHSTRESRSRSVSKSVRFAKGKRTSVYVAESENELESSQDEPDQAISSSDGGEEKARVAIEMVGSVADDSAADNSEAEASSSVKENSNLDETALMALSSKRDPSVWTFNSAANAYITDQIDTFEVDPTRNESERHKIIISDRTFPIKGCGTINVRLPHSNIRLHNALFIPNLGANLVSSSRIVLDGFQAIYDHKNCTVSRKSDNQIMFQAERLSNDRL